MSLTLISSLSIILLLVVMLIGIPIAFSLGIGGFVGLSYASSFKTALLFLPRDLFETFSSYSISAICMFVLMGYYGFGSGLGKRLFEAANTIFGAIKGGLIISTIFACAGFGAICGSCTATSATMGKLALPVMRKYGYDELISVGAIAASGTLGILIPPSVVLLIYGILTSQSIAKLFIAGIIPGVILASFMAIYVYFIFLKNPRLAPSRQKFSFKQRLVAIANTSDVIILFLLVIGGLLLGFFTPTQSGAIGAFGALVIGILRKELSWRIFLQNTKEALKTSCMILTVMGFATIFGHFVTLSNITFALSDFLNQTKVPGIIIILFIVVIYLIGGMFVDSLPFMILTVPIFYPIVVGLGYDPIWFGVILTILTGIGTITPPVGINVYIMKAVSEDLTLHQIFKGAVGFLIPMLCGTLVLILVPSITLFLPNFFK